MKTNYEMKLNEIEEKVDVLEKSKVLLKLYREAVILEQECINSESADIKEIGYQAQTLQGRISRLLI